MVAPALAQEATTAARAAYLPLVVGKGQSVNVSEEAPAEEDLTDSVDGVEAASQNNSGLVFVSTNAADPIRGNEIVMYQRAADGALTLSGRFPTSGQGLGSGLGSQDSLILSKNPQQKGARSPLLKLYFKNFFNF
ncbi:MAG: hypothetical protein HC781_18265 [Leptolyngbyaceae cyanobacterium CSU_1_4]|nr:hypothetical protein [Leptolyngbyaceae cyanobacterium CSU_1_4]